MSSHSHVLFKRSTCQHTACTAGKSCCCTGVRKRRAAMDCSSCFTAMHHKLLFLRLLCGITNHEPKSPRWQQQCSRSCSARAPVQRTSAKQLHMIQATPSLHECAMDTYKQRAMCTCERLYVATNDACCHVKTRLPLDAELHRGTALCKHAWETLSQALLLAALHSAIPAAAIFIDITMLLPVKHNVTCTMP